MVRLNFLKIKYRLKQILATPLYINATYLMLSTAVVSVSGFFFWLIVARIYPENEVGYSSGIISVLHLIAMLSMAGLHMSLIRFLPRSGKPAVYINTCFTLVSILSLAFAGIFLIGIDLWSPELNFIKQNMNYYLLFLAAAPVWSIFQITTNVFVAKRRGGFNFTIRVIFSLLLVPLLIILALVNHTFIGVVISWGIALVIALSAAIFLFLPKVQDGYKPLPALNLNLIKGEWGYSAGNYLISLLATSPRYLLPVMVINLLGPVQTAYFYIIWTISNMLYAIPVAVAQSLFSEGSHNEDNIKINVRKSLKITFLLLIPAAIMLAGTGKWLLLAFGQNYSSNGLNLLWILCLSAFPRAIIRIYTSILQVHGKIRELVVIWGLLTIITLVTSYLLMPVTGIMGIGYAWLGISSIFAIYAIINIRRNTR